MTDVIASSVNSEPTKGYFAQQLSDLNWSEITALHQNATSSDVDRALSASKRTLADFAALISPAAVPKLMDMIAQANALTRARYGNTMSLFAPLYLSNTCANECTYCGFSMSNPLKRLTLNQAQIEQEIAAIKGKGFDHVLLVTGETSKVSMPYFQKVLPLFRQHFSQVSMEVQPLSQQDYQQLQALGLDGVLVYQETYHQPTYQKHHLRGNKTDFVYRLETPDRLGQAQMHKIGLGVLLGLEDWRTDTLMMASHLRFLQKKYWRSRFSIGFPRLRPCVGGIEPKSVITDRELVQLIAAWRLFDADVELSLSTRESPEFRRFAGQFGITTMSAESKTQPGGYAEETPKALEQFSIHDDRSVAEVAKMLTEQELQVVWKDWDPALRS
ncbi:2-iminoacetate synthase ThiH [Maribrevibacterium harenarium]|uniref:2-iminoacetate synthase ThiH n=1 Tax=Maribrevibacterium harenarium TaxID=2589817 RepID=A0A501X0K3_9GAMM|nr:2-iminoacetate synthase ThiH [Maribrevibacterium harenarium]TPE52326.1 2-iminoacetate synthase ThiH [Maribrevibacterium harenarium]